MRILTTVLVLILSLCWGVVSFADKGGHKGGNDSHRGPSDRAYDRASDNAAFKRTKDWEPGTHPDKPKKKLDGAEGDHKKKDDHKRKHKRNSDGDDKGKENEDNNAENENPDTSLTNQTGS
ncbi:MAG: hypothetical protein JNN05_06225 [Candidatus Omnitrophica bacterium]|nr:hypothetical protein [Candidatus Omnitrophota bacterium]